MNQQLKSTPIEQYASLIPFNWQKNLASWTIGMIDIFSIDNVLQEKNIYFEGLI
ncbi:hypothetical protein QUF74_00040 [Candidatus Halobeggiatoa sp. HSG11]|nr:hypothetical protein [Candidatus Halobeggiatoa sp. HSG11]